ncbi:6-carboxytetrahydropterin synthase [Aquimarina sp. D1M17]|uniref:6-pyruvoyl trahydropterin synthase family protein n=1 Tax=Aquimarina acroporae TaxID=2937283 RepID=UPI0020C02AB0|nr:6-carboxytetrahydropterin synthase [Aquimarina acroporae]MCK8520105.1 6-carboxytetrahydropterin synthase [Aquimarina acroporae]
MAERDSSQRKTAIIRREHFNAAHRLHNPSWSEEKNEKVFGKCNNVYYHGHNYELEVKVIGYINPETGYVMDAKVLSDVIKEKVTDRFDHKNLNIEVDDFKNLNPTAENIVFVTYNILREAISEELDLQIRLYETPRNYVEYPY